MIDKAIQHYHYADFLFYVREPRGAKHRLMERHLAACDTCRQILAKMVRF